MNMMMGGLEIGVLLLAIATMLWLLPKSLPQLGRPYREYREEMRQR